MDWAIGNYHRQVQAATKVCPGITRSQVQQIASVATASSWLFPLIFGSSIQVDLRPKYIPLCRARDDISKLFYWPMYQVRSKSAFHSHAPYMLTCPGICNNPAGNCPWDLSQEQRKTNIQVLANSNGQAYCRISRDSQSRLRITSQTTECCRMDFGVQSSERTTNL